MAAHTEPELAYRCQGRTARTGAAIACPGCGSRRPGASVAAAQGASAGRHHSRPRDRAVPAAGGYAAGSGTPGLSHSGALVLTFSSLPRPLIVQRFLLVHRAPLPEKFPVAVECFFYHGNVGGVGGTYQHNQTLPLDLVAGDRVTDHFVFPVDVGQGSTNPVPDQSADNIGPGQTVDLQVVAMRVVVFV